MAIIMRNGLEADFDPNKMRTGELAVVTDARELHATFAPGDSPKVLLDGEAVPNPETAGTNGQILSINEDGDPEWGDFGAPTDEQVGEAVSDWLDAHPEATTTVQDGAITYAKLDSNLKGTVDDVSELKSDIEYGLFDGKNLYDTKTTSINNNTAIVNNHDGTYTVGTSDYGNTTFGRKTLIKAGVYKLYGVPQGKAHIGTTYKPADAIVINESSSPKVFTLTEDTKLILAFTTSQPPSESFIITPYLYQTKIEDMESDKADADGTYPTLTAGNLATEDGANNNTPYLFRASGGGVRVGEREYDKIVGGTVAWNQLVQNGDFSDGATEWETASGNSSLSVTDGIATVTIVSGSPSSYNPALRQNVPGILNHIYYVNIIVKPTVDTKLYFGGNNGVFWNNTITGGVWNELKIIVKATELTGLGYIFSYLGHLTTAGMSIGDSISFKRVAVYDLTQMFGTTIADYLYALETATAGAGVAKLKEWGFFTKPYYPYNAGELKSVEGLSSHDMVGFNQWDEEWVNGYINDSGVFTARNDIVGTKNGIPVLPNTTYYFHRNNQAFITYWKKSEAYNALVSSDFISRASLAASVTTFTTPNDCYAVHFNMVAGYGATYNHDICINLSDPAKDGTYEPYVKHTYPLDSDLTLRGIPKLDSANQLYYDGDTYESDGTVTRRYGIVDMGSLTWTYVSSDTVFYATISDKKSGEASMRCVRYQAAGLTGYSTPDYIIGQSSNSSLLKRIFIGDPNYTTAAAFKESLSGVMLVYELETSTAETADPFAAPQIVDQYGTEEYVTTGIVPVGHETFYPENLRQKIEGLPWNFASLIAPTEVAYTATQNYTTGRLFIVNNVLYKATANIANGGAITPGTNCQATTLAAVIAAL